MSCLLLASSRALRIRALKARGFSTPCVPSPLQDPRRASSWILFTICRGQWTKVTLCLTLSSAWTYAMRLQCAAIECDGLMCLAEQKIVSSSLLLTRVYFLLKEFDEKMHVLALCPKLTVLTQCPTRYGAPPSLFRDRQLLEVSSLRALSRVGTAVVAIGRFCGYGPCEPPVKFSRCWSRQKCP